MDGNNGFGILSTATAAPVYYTTDGGQTFTASSTPLTGTSAFISLVGTRGILARSDGLWYSSNAGQTWTQSNLTGFSMNSVAMASATVALASSTTAGIGIYYSTNGGVTWTQSLQTTGSFRVAIANNSALAIAARISGGFYYSTNAGVNWTVSNISTGTYNQIVINSSGQAISSSNNMNLGIYYSSDGGQTWSQSNLTTQGYLLSQTETGAIAAASSTNVSAFGMYYSTNGGQTWTVSNYTSQLFRACALFGSNAVAALDGTSGIIYSTGPLCFHRDTLVLCEDDVYRPIHELQVGDRVQTYKHGLVPIRHIASFELINGLFSAEAAFLYKHRQTGLMVSGEHRMLVSPDAFSEEARAEQKRKYGLDEEVDGLLMWMACLHPDFEKVPEHGSYSMYHLVLEHNDEPMRHYGIYVNGGLIAETCHEADFHKLRKKG